jgi:hypothetical protein
MKKLIALALAAVAVVGVVPTAFADQARGGISVGSRREDPWRHWGRDRAHRSRRDDHRDWRRDHRPSTVIVVPRHPGAFIPGPGVGRYPAYRPHVWIAPHWTWNGFGWVWIPGYWARR